MSMTRLNEPSSSMSSGTTEDVLKPSFIPGGELMIVIMMLSSKLLLILVGYTRIRSCS
jgi:hypothetical protein